MDFTDRQLPLDKEILNGLIAATPEEWSQIDYVVDVTWLEGYEDLFMQITSPEGHPPAGVSPELADATTRLFALIKEHGFRLKTIRGHAWLDEKGRWMYRADFEYMPDEGTT